MVKSAKIIPVMLGGIFITGKKYHLADYVSAAMLAGGVAVFSVAGGNTAGASKSHGHGASASASAAEDAAAAAAALMLLTGGAILFVTLCCDALLGNFQEKIMTEAGVSPLKMMLMQAMFGVGLTLVLGTVTGAPPPHAPPPHAPSRPSDPPISPTAAAVLRPLLRSSLPPKIASQASP